MVTLLPSPTKQTVPQARVLRTAAMRASGKALQSSRQISPFAVRQVFDRLNGISGLRVDGDVRAE